MTAKRFAIIEAGTTANNEVVPKVVPAVMRSGDANQGREMKVLPCERDEFYAALAA